MKTNYVRNEMDVAWHFVSIIIVEEFRHVASPKRLSAFLGDWVFVEFLFVGANADAGVGACGSPPPPPF